MRLFAIQEEGFKEYEEAEFGAEYREQTMESWLEDNPDCIVEDGSLLIIGRQVTTNLGTSIDLLALDREGSVAVLELKRDKTPRETLAQALEYASFAASLDYQQLETIYQSYTGAEGVSLAERHRLSFALDENEAVSFNKDQRIIIVASNVTPPVRQSAEFLRRKGLRVTCLEFSYFCAKSGERLLSTDIVVGMESIEDHNITTASLPKTDRPQFLKACNEAGRPVFEAILAFADRDGLPIHWGTRGFSLNVDLDGTHVALCFGYPAPTKRDQASQGVSTAFGEIARKVENSSELIEAVRERLLDTGLFVPAGKGREVKCLVQQKPTTEQVDAVVGILHDLAQKVEALAESNTHNET